MRVNAFTEFQAFINELDLIKNSFTSNELYNLFTNRKKDFYILDLEKRKVIETSQTFSLDSEYISHIEEVTTFELYIEHMEQSNIDTTVLTFRTLKDLKKVKQFIKNNFKFLKKQ